MGPQGNAKGQTDPSRAELGSEQFQTLSAIPPSCLGSRTIHFYAFSLVTYCVFSHILTNNDIVINLMFLSQRIR